MQIRRVHILTRDVSRRDPSWRTANYAAAAVTAVYVGIEIDGVIGVGASAAKTRHDTATELVSALATTARTTLEGAPYQDARELLRTAPVLPRRAMLAVDLALHDLTGKLAGVPAETAWGERQRPSIEAIRMVGQKAPSELEAALGPLVDAGWSHFKLKGGSGVQADTERVDAIRVAFGDRVRVMVDANGAYTPDEAIHLCRELGARGVEVVEQPVAYDDVAGLARVRHQSDTRLLADQCVWDVASATDVCRAGAADAISIKPTKMGTVEMCLRVAEVCLGFGVAVHIGGTAAPALVDGAACRLALSDDRFGDAAEVAESEGLNEGVGGGPDYHGGRASVRPLPGLGGPEHLFRGTDLDQHTPAANTEQGEP